MKRPNVRAFESGTSFRLPWAPTAGWSTFPGAFTLVEVLVATVLSLIIMAAVVTVFASISTSISQSRSTLEMSDRLRTTAAQLKRDLEGVTVTMLPPRRPETNEGYFEYIEGPVGPVFMPESPRSFSNGSSGTVTLPYAYDTDRTLTSGPSAYAADTTIGDNDDILMFTTRAKDRPFVGKTVTFSGSTAIPTTIESSVAEVAWFVRGRTLYHRVLLVAPSTTTLTPSSGSSPPLPGYLGPSKSGYTGGIAIQGYYANCDVSAHVDSNGNILANSLGDLTKRENRFAHPYKAGFPYDARVWGQLGLPTLRETAANAFPLLPGSTATTATVPSLPPFMARDYWINPYPWTSYVDVASGTQSVYYDTTVTRITDDVVMTNVVGFDVKAWDPGAPVLQYGNQILMPGDPYYTTLMTGGSMSGVTVAYYGAYADLGWGPAWAAPAGSGAPIPVFNHLGTGTDAVNKSGLVAAANPTSNQAPTATNARVYDTYSLHYEYDGLPENGSSSTNPDLGTNGLADTAGSYVDPLSEAETCPPYPAPLRGIQIKIRAMDPDSGQVREVTVVQEFLPQ